MSTTYINLMRRVLQMTGQEWRLSVTTGASASVITDTKLRRYIKAVDVANDQWWVYFEELNNVTPPASADDVKRLITDSTTTTATLESDLSANTASGDVYLLMTFDPDHLKNAINFAIRDLFSKGLYLPIVDESLIVDNLLTNPSFTGSVTSNAFTGWSRGGAATVTAETTIFRDAWAAQSAKMVGTVVGDGQYQAPHIGQDEMTDKTAYLAGHVYCTTADKARLRLNWDTTWPSAAGTEGTNYTSHALHDGTDEWQFQKIETSIPTAATKAEAWCSSAGTAYFNKVALCIDPIYRYTIPASMVRGPYKIEMQADERKIGTDAPFFELGRSNRPIRGRTLRLYGAGLMSTLTADADTVEADNDQVDLIAARAAQELYSILAGAPSSQRDHYLREHDRWAARVEADLRAGKARSTLQGASVSSSWGVDPAGSTTRYLWLKDYRG